MREVRHILVPVNGTEESLNSLTTAAAFAQIYKARITLLLVTYLKEDTDNTNTADRDSWLPAPVAGSVSRYAHAVFAAALSILPDDCKVDTYHASGQPTAKILEFAAKNDVDMIIIGCRKLSFLDTILKGSVSRRILEKATCPVIIVK